MYHVGIAGPIGAGKSFLAHQLERNLDNAFVVPFATQLKKVADIGRIKSARDRGIMLESYLNTLRCDDASIAFKIMAAYDLYPQIEGEKPRKLLQVIGTDIVRAWNPDFWINNILNYCWLAYPTNAIIIHDDVRFLNEAYFVDSLIEITGIDYTGEHSSEVAEWKGKVQPDYQIQHMFTDCIWLADAIREDSTPFVT